MDTNIWVIEVLAIIGMLIGVLWILLATQKRWTLMRSVEIIDGAQKIRGRFAPLVLVFLVTFGAVCVVGALLGSGAVQVFCVFGLLLVARLPLEGADPSVRLAVGFIEQISGIVVWAFGGTALVATKQWWLLFLSCVGTVLFVDGRLLRLKAYVPTANGDAFAWRAFHDSARGAQVEPFALYLRPLWSTERDEVSPDAISGSILDHAVLLHVAAFMALLPFGAVAALGRQTHVTIRGYNYFVGMLKAQTGVRNSLEHILGRACSPLIAIGQNDLLNQQEWHGAPSFLASTSYDWRKKFRTLAPIAHIVFINPARTNGLGEEIDWLMEHRALAKCIFVRAPRLSEDEWRRRIEPLRSRGVPLPAISDAALLNWNAQGVRVHRLSKMDSADIREGVAAFGLSLLDR